MALMGSRKVCPECHRGELKFPGDCRTCAGAGSIPTSHLLADRILETTPPRRSDEESSAKGFLIAMLWLAVVVAGGMAWRGCG
jgi:hypothetical protein